MRKKPNVIFLGAFKPAAADGTIGGQAFACLSLVESPLSESVEWLLIDSTQRSQPPPGFLFRLYYAAGRAMTSLWWLITRRVQATLIFTRYEFSSFLEKGIIAIMARILGRRSIISIRSEVRPFGHDKFTNGFRKFVVWLCDAIICQSEEAAGQLVQFLNCPREKIVVIPNWIDTTAYTVENRVLDETKPVRFLFLGWLEEYKGVHHLLDAASQLKSEGYSFEIEIGGGGSEKESLIQQCSELGLSDSVQFLGWVSGEEKSDAFARSQVLVLPSYSEGMPNSILEAMASGMGVIATPVGGIPALIASEEQGFLVAAGESTGLAVAMKKYIDDRSLIEQTGRRNEAIAKQKHDVESVWPVVAQALGIETEGKPVTT
jgi:glycosyltransferase involved in cell wall biosynthesis